jgi:helicase
MTGRLLTDRYAAHAAVTHAVLELLSSAGTEDVIVISFAGHGSPDGRLMLFDTSVTALAETTLSMSDLAQAFRSTKARAVLCILDCCFSGRAPARILEVAPSRNAFALAEVQGEGRIILSVARHDNRHDTA